MLFPNRLNWKTTEQLGEEEADSSSDQDYDKGVIDVAVSFQSDPGKQPAEEEEQR